MNMPKDLEHNPKSAWEIYKSKKHAQTMDRLAARYVEFLSRCKTERETVAYVRQKLEQAGFSEDFKADACFRVLRGKTVFMARRGEKSMAAGIRVLGAHADTPRLDLKQHPLYEDVDLALAKTHYYGGIRKHQWPARPLALHGVVARADGETVDVVVGEDPKDPVLTISDLLPHLAYGQMEKKLSKAFEAEKLNLIFGHAPSLDSGKKTQNQNNNKKVKKKILELLFTRYGLVEEDLYSAELQAVPAGPARYVGLDEAMIGGYGHDDRACLFSALEAFMGEKKPGYTQIVLFWDKEEIGSEGSTGAKSLFFEYCIKDLIGAWEPTARFDQVMDKAKAVSADVHAGIDPDYQDLHEKLNAARMGYGPCFSKYTGHRGKYGANDAHAEYVGWIRRVLNKAKVPWQMAELGKVDLGGGGTVAKFLAAYGMDIIDCGPPVLSMHSPFEIISKADLYATTQAFRAFLKS